MHEYTSDEKSFIYLKRIPNQTIEETKEFIQHAVEGYRDGSERLWGITLPGEQRIIGTIRLYDIKDSTAYISYMVGPKAAGKGVGTASVSLVMQFAFEELDIKKILAYCEIENKASERVLQKNGMKLIEVLPSYMTIGDAPHDFYLYGIKHKGSS